MSLMRAMAHEQRKLAGSWPLTLSAILALWGATRAGRWRACVSIVRNASSRHSHATAAGAGGVGVALPRRSRVQSQSRFHLLLRSLVLRLGTMTYLLRFFQLPD